MKRYTSKISRRYGENLQLKGERDEGPKAAFRRKPYPPGIHGRTRRRKVSEYGLQLAEKQKLRIMYGLSEKQFRRFIEKAQNSSEPTNVALLKLLERRLDNVVFRLGLADSRAQARQYVAHGHINVNGSRINIPSYIVRKGDAITVRERARQLKPFTSLTPKKLKNIQIPEWLTLDIKKLEAKVMSDPDPAQLKVPVEVPMIIEFYAR